MNQILRNKKVSSKTQVNRYSPSVLRHGLTARDLTITDNFVISLKRFEARADEAQYWEFDLKDVHLPANDLYKKSVRLSGRGDFVAALLYGIDAFVARTDESISRTRRIAVYVSEIVLCFEALWVRNITSIDGMTPDDFRQIAYGLSSGGWESVLGIRERALAAEVKREDCIGPLAGKNLRARLKTNFWHVALYLRSVYPDDHEDSTAATIDEFEDERVAANVAAVHAPTSQAQSNGARYSDSRFSQLFQAANLLFDADQGYGLAQCPFPPGIGLAERLGQPKGRTSNLTIGFAGRLFRICMVWVYERAPAVIALLDELVSAVEQKAKLSRKVLGKTLPDIFENSENRRRLGELLPFPLLQLDKNRSENDSYSFRSTITNLLAACFVLIAFMNARRKNEVSHRKFGLMCSALQVHSEELKLYEVAFYLEKTHRKRLAFYVNDTTCISIRVLEQLQERYRRLDLALPSSTSASTPLREIPLFSYRRFSVAKGVGDGRKWFDFGEYSRSDSPTTLVREAGGGTEWMFSETQVFRRMYCLIYYYRYENADVVALTLQMGQTDFHSVQTYLVDPLSRPEIESIYASIPTEADDRRRAFMDEMRELARELDTAGNEKLAEDVFGILAGDAVAGGFARYVRRLHARFAKCVAFDSSDLSDAVFHAAKRRGNFPRPLRHGECMLGSARDRRSAHCYVADDDAAHKELASPARCADCKFHLTKLAYLRNLEADCEVLTREMNRQGITPFELERKRRELAALEDAIEALRHRLGLSIDE